MSWISDIAGDVVGAAGDLAEDALGVAGDAASALADGIVATAEGAYSVAENVVDGVQSIGEFIGEYSDVLGMIVNPMGFLAGEVAGYIASNIDWIKDPIDLLQGDTDPIQALCEEWKSISDELAGVASTLAAGSKMSADSWQGDAGQKYRKVAASFAKLLTKSASLARSAADRINTVGNLVSEARSEVIEMVFDCLERCVRIMYMALAAAVFSLGGSIAAGIAAIVREAVSTVREVEERLERLDAEVGSALEGLAEVESAFLTIQRTLEQASQNVRNPRSAGTETPGRRPAPARSHAGSGRRPSTGGHSGTGGYGSGSDPAGSGSHSGAPGGGSAGGGGPSGGGASGGGGPSGGGGGGEPEEPTEEDKAEKADKVDDSEAAVTDLPDGSKVLHPYLVASITDAQWEAMAQNIPRELWEAMAADPDAIPPELAQFAPDDLADRFPSNAPDWEPPLGEDGRPKPTGAVIPADLVPYMTPEMERTVADFDMEAGKEAWEQENLTEEERLRDDLKEAKTPEEKVVILERLDQIHEAEEARQEAEAAREAEEEAAERAAEGTGYDDGLGSIGEQVRQIFRPAQPL